MDRLDSHCQSPILLRLCIRCKGSKSRANFLKDLNCLTKTASAQKYFSTFSMQLHLFNSLKRGSLNHIGEPFAPATMRALAARTLPTVHLSSLILTETLTRPNICVLFFSFLFFSFMLSFLSVKVGVIGNSRNARARARASAQPRCIAGIRLNCRGYSKSFGGSGTVGSGAVFRNATHDPFQIGKQ